MAKHVPNRCRTVAFSFSFQFKSYASKTNSVSNQYQAVFSHTNPVVLNHRFWYLKRSIIPLAVMNLQLVKGKPEVENSSISLIVTP